MNKPKQLLSALIAALALFSAPNAEARNARAKAPPIARPALWKVADADTTIYLFGTVHILPNGVNWYHGPVAQAFEGSQELVTEILEADPAQMQTLVMTKAVLPKGENLRAMMSAAEKAKYDAALKSLGIPVQTFDTFEPWYAAIGITTLPLMKSGLDPASGVDNQLSAKAKTQNRLHTALETAEYQLGLFDSLPLDSQKRYLAEIIKGLPEIPAELNKMIDAWKKGDANKLAKLINEQEDDPALMQKLLLDRNKIWADWIKARMDKPGVVFMAVGAGHLAGRGSVQDELSAKSIVSVRVQ